MCFRHVDPSLGHTRLDAMLAHVHKSRSSSQRSLGTETTAIIYGVGSCDFTGWAYLAALELWSVGRMEVRAGDSSDRRTDQWTLKLCRCGISSILKPRAPIALSIFKMRRKHVSSLAFILPLLASTADAVSDPARPRGVAPECRLHMLQLTESFHVDA